MWITNPRLRWSTDCKSVGTVECKSVGTETLNSKPLNIGICNPVGTEGEALKGRHWDIMVSLFQGFFLLYSGFIVILQGVRWEGVKESSSSVFCSLGFAIQGL